MSTPSHGVIGALAVVTALAYGCGGEGGSASPDTRSTPASESTTPTGPIAWVDALPIGPPPTIGYVIGHTYHSPDGRTVALPTDRGTTAIARLGDGFLVVDDRHWEGTSGVGLLDARGNRVREIGTVAGPPVLSEDGTTVRWITFSPAEVGAADRSPTRLHVGDVRSGEIRSRVIHRDDPLPRVADPGGLVALRVRGDVVVVLDRGTREPVARLASPGT